MKVYNFGKKNKVQRQIEVYNWAKRLEAEEMIIHNDGSITLNCRYGNICERYNPTSKELKEK